MGDNKCFLNMFAGAWGLDDGVISIHNKLNRKKEANSHFANDVKRLEFELAKMSSQQEKRCDYCDRKVSTEICPYCGGLN